MNTLIAHLVELSACSLCAISWTTHCEYILSVPFQMLMKYWILRIVNIFISLPISVNKPIYSHKSLCTYIYSIDDFTLCSTESGCSKILSITNLLKALLHIECLIYWRVVFKIEAFYPSIYRYSIWNCVSFLWKPSSSPNDAVHSEHIHIQTLDESIKWGRKTIIYCNSIQHIYFRRLLASIMLLF